MRLLIGLALIALACALLAAGVGAQERSLSLEERSASGLTVTWSWSGQAASAFEVAWRAGGDDDQTAWRSVRKDAAERRHMIEQLEAGVRYIVRVRGLDGAGRPIDDLRGIFATTQSGPRLLRVIASDDGALTVAWSQPSDWTPRGWRLSWRVAGSQTAGGTIDLPAAARSRRIDGLTTGADYRIRLTALNSRGGESPAQTLRATAADTGLATSKLTALTWSGLTIRAEWETVPRASGYDLFWRAADERGGAVGRLSVAGTSAEFAVPAAGVYRVEVRARSGAGRSAAHGDRSPPRSIALRPAPAELRVQRFDGEYVHLTWRAVGAERYAVEWGARGGAVRTALRAGGDAAGAEPTLSLGPLAGGTTYEFRVRARNDQGGSAPSPAATLTPTLWPETPPPGLWLFATFNHQTGGIDVTPPAVAGAPWYEAQWVNYADDAERGRARSSGAERRVRLSRAGGFENGLWYIRVRAGPWGTWSTRAHYHRVISQPPRLALALESSRELCTAGTLTEVSWKISGGSAPYALSVENSAVDVSADNVRVNCGALTEAEAGDAEAALAAKTVSAVVTDSRGVQRQAALDVQRARALPAPQNVRYAPELGIARTFWDWVEGAGSQSPEILAGGGNTQRDGYLVRYRAAGAGTWIYAEFRIPGRAGAWEIAGPSVHEMQVAAVRHSIEAETPAALRWSETLRYVYATAPENAAVSATATTVTVSWDAQPLAGAGSIILEGPRGVKVGRFVEPTEPGRHSYTFSDVPPETSYEVVIDKSTPTGRASGRVSMSVRTSAEPPGSAALPVGPQNVRAHATLESITVTWEAPHAGASDRYNVEVVEEATNALVDIHWINGPDRSVTLRSVFQRIRPATKYRVRVTHAGIVTSTVELVVTTPAAGPSGAQSDPPAEPPPILPTGLFFPYWPARLDDDFVYTDDPFDWRTGDARYHAAIDIGFYNWAVAQDRTGAIDDDAPGEPVYAAAAGTLRIINDNFDSLQYLLYCPNESSVLQEQFVVHDEHEKYDETVKQLTCHYFVGPSSGRTAVILHELVDGSVVVTKYAHLRKGSIPDSIIASLGTVNGYVDHNKSVDVSAGTKIGEIGHSGEADSDLHRAGSYFCRTGPEAGAKADCSPGNWALKGDEEECAEGQHCEHAFIDPHIHFEVRYFQGQQPFDWYDWAWGCDGHEDNHHSGEYCQWTATRRLATVIDPETVLPPAPASWRPRDAGLRGRHPDCRVRNRIECMNANRRVVEIDNIAITVDDQTKILNAALSVQCGDRHCTRASQQGRCDSSGLASAVHGPASTDTVRMCHAMTRRREMCEARFTLTARH